MNHVKFSGEYRISVNPNNLWQNETLKDKAMSSSAMLKHVMVDEVSADQFKKNVKKISCHVAVNGNQVFVKTPIDQSKQEQDASLVERLLTQFGFSNGVVDLIKTGILNQPKQPDGFINGVPELKHFPVRLLQYQGSALMTVVKNLMDNSPQYYSETGKADQPLKILDFLKFHPNAHSLTEPMLSEIMGAAFSGGKTDIIDYLLIDKKLPITARGENGYTMAHCAARGGQVELIKMLQKKGLSLTSVAGNLKETLLHVAAIHGQLSVAKYLLSQSVDINAQDDLGYTPLHNASMGFNLEVANYLVEKGADLNIQSKDGETVAHAVSENLKGLPLLKTFLNKGVSFNTPMASGLTAFEYAILKLNNEAVNYLLKHDQSLDLTKENNAVICASSMLNEPLLRILHKKGASFNVSDAAGNTPAHYAVHYFTPTLLIFLRDIGVDFKLRNKEGLDAPALRNMTFAELNEYLDQFKTLHLGQEKK